MNYSQAIEYLFNSAPLFQNIGAGAYKEGLSNTHILDQHFGHPHHSYRTIHVAGTNGKGSVSHTLAAILQSQGYRVGLYTSPHLVDFRERIRVNGVPISHERVIDFVVQERSFFEPLHPSFFELTTALAFRYFQEQKVDIAVIEVGLGGRLDCTNIISPILSVITNISKDHTQFLGDTLEKIASEKAGIIKGGIPVVIGETNGNDAVRNVFVSTAQSVGTTIRFADEQSHPAPPTQLQGKCQKYNTQTILTAIDVLREAGLQISQDSVRDGFAHVCELTGLMGRWQCLGTNPTIICDTGHNIGGWQYLGEQLREVNGHVRIVMGMVGDKDVNAVLQLLPPDATYYFTQASVQRAMPVAEFATLAAQHGLHGNQYDSVMEAFQAARADASPDDFIFVGGSTFIVADLLSGGQILKVRG